MAEKTMVIAGATGVVGRHLVAAAHESGYQVRVLTRHVHRDPGFDTPCKMLRWEPRAAADGKSYAVIDLAHALEGADVIVNLAGASLADGRLDHAHRRRVVESRIDATRALKLAWERADDPPGVWIQASAVGYYGDTGEEPVDEDGKSGKLFLSEVCERWENEAPEEGPRVAILRIGLVLAEDAPAWEQMLQPIRLGLGGKLGSGQQWWAWIDADELARVVLFLAGNDDAQGVFNGTAPEPVRQIELTSAVASRLRRPAFLPAPAAALRVVLGPVADELLLPSCRAVPARLQEAGYEFQWPALENVLDKFGY